MGVKKKSSPASVVYSAVKGAIGNNFLQPLTEEKTAMDDLTMPGSEKVTSPRKRVSETSEVEDEPTKKKMKKTKKIKLAKKSKIEGSILRKDKVDRDVPTNPDSKKSVSFANGQKNIGVPKQTIQTGKPNWKEVKERKKALKQTRKQKNVSSYDKHLEAKKLYESLKIKKCPKNEKDKKVSRLYALLKGHFIELVYKHDMARVVQLLIKLADDATRTAISSELKSEVPRMTQSVYGSHTVKTLLQFGSSAVKKEVIAMFKGSIEKLLKNKISAAIMGFAYRCSSTMEDRSWMRRELSGFVDDKTTSELLEVVSKTGCFSTTSVEAENVASLINSVREPAETVMMMSLKNKLLKLIEKGLATNDLVQSVLNDYLMKCTSENKEEILPSIQPCMQQTINEGITTLDRAMALMEFAWFGTNKDRKWLVKQLHHKMPDVCFGKNCYFVIISVLDCIDDTVLLKKTLLKDIIDNRRKFVENKFGWKVIMHIVSPRDPKHFSPSYVGLLELGDATARKKKPAAVRQAELLEPVLSALIDDISSDLPYWLSSGRQILLTREVLAKSEGSQLEDIFQKIAKFVCHERHFWAQKSHREEWMLEELIKNDSTCFQKNNVSFSSFLLQEMTEEGVKMLVQKSSGYFLFNKLVGTGIPQVQETVARMFKPNVMASIGDHHKDEFHKLLKTIPELVKNRKIS